MFGGGAGGAFWSGFLGKGVGKAAGRVVDTFATGVFSGIFSGAAGGAAGGFAQGFGNALTGGENFGQALWKGTTSGLWGLGIGGISGDIWGGIDAAKHDRNIWTGADKQNMVIKINQGKGELIGWETYNAKHTTQHYCVTIFTK